MQHKDCQKGQKVRVRQHNRTLTSWVGTTPHTRSSTIQAHEGVIDEIYSEESDTGTAVVYSDRYGYLEVSPADIEVA